MHRLNFGTRILSDDENELESKKIMFTVEKIGKMMNFMQTESKRIDSLDAVTPIFPISTSCMTTLNLSNSVG